MVVYMKNLILRCIDGGYCKGMNLAEKRGGNMGGRILVTRSSMPDFEEYIEEIKDLWDSHWLTNMGIKHKQLEAELSRYLDTLNITLFTNGHLALECAIAAFNLTGEVITTPFTFASTTHAIVRNGLEPVFCDVNPDDYTIDTDKLESLITDKTSAIIPVHVYGNICNINEIENLAKKYNLKVIYDAAHAFGVTVNGESVANFGDASMFSFHATKVFHTIEGGAVTYKDGSLSKKLNDLKNFGITGPESVEYVGGNAKMNEFQAAMGICNLRHVEGEIAKRKIVVESYIERLNGVRGIRLCKPQTGVKSNYAYFPVVFDGYKMNRDEVFEKLKAENIYARKYFYPLTNSFECYKGRFDVEKTPVAKYVADRVLTLPLYADLAIEDVDRICDIILT
jgi:dTDP-4-amino-4,6-dideoxygalactose transaminase